MTCNFQAFMDVFKPFHLLILSNLAGYLLAAPVTLRLWITTQKVPSLPLREDKPLGWKKKTVGYGILLLLLAVEYRLVFHTSEKVLSGVLSIFFGNVFFRHSWVLFTRDYGWTNWSVHRNAQGVPTRMPVMQKRNRKQKAVLWGGLWAALAVTVGAFATNQPALTAAVSMAVVYNKSSHIRFKTVSMRWTMIGLLGWIAGSMLLGAAVTLFLISKGHPVSDSDISVQVPSPLAQELVLWVKEKYWIFSPFYAYVPGILIALCLRFDYRRHLDTSPDSAFEPILTQVPAPEYKKNPRRQFGEGIVVPSHAPTAFSKVYYTTALVAWGIAQLGLICLDTFTAISLDSGYEFSVMVLVLELPLMCLALMAVAAIRGEWKALWNYREVWTVKPQPKDATSSETALLTPMEKEKKVADVEHTAEP